MEIEDALKDGGVTIIAFPLPVTAFVGVLIGVLCSHVSLVVVNNEVTPDASESALCDDPAEVSPSFVDGINVEPTIRKLSSCIECDAGDDGECS